MNQEERTGLGKESEIQAGIKSGRPCLSMARSLDFIQNIMEVTGGL